MVTVFDIIDELLALTLVFALFSFGGQHEQAGRYLLLHSSLLHHQSWILTEDITSTTLLFFNCYKNYCIAHYSESPIFRLVSV
jgi:hypothetical protein